MESANIVRYTNPRQANLFGHTKVVLHKFDARPQPKKERQDLRAEIQNLKYPVRTVNTHNDPVLDVLDVIEYLADASRAIKPSADPAHKKGSLVQCLEFLCLARAEMDDAIEVVCKALEAERENWRELPCMQETPRPIFTELD